MFDMHDIRIICVTTAAAKNQLLAAGFFLVMPRGKG